MDFHKWCENAREHKYLKSEAKVHLLGCKFLCDDNMTQGKYFSFNWGLDGFA